MRSELSLVAYTLLSQAAIGACWVLLGLLAWAGRRVGAEAAAALVGPLLPVPPALMLLAMLASLLHLGRPVRAWRALGNLRSSWLSREILFTGLFAGSSAMLALLHLLGWGGPEWQRALLAGSALLGVGLWFSMVQSYRLRTVPAWAGWLNGLSFLLTALLLGALLVGAMLGSGSETAAAARRGLALGARGLLWAQLLLFALWARRPWPEGEDLRPVGRPGRVHLWLFWLRVLLALAAALWLKFLPGEMAWALLPALASEALGRLLFYESRIRLTAGSVDC